MTFPLKLRPPCGRFLGQIVFQAQIDLGIMSLLHTAPCFGEVEEHLDRIWQSVRYFRVEGHMAERFKNISTTYNRFLLLHVFFPSSQEQSRCEQ